MKLTVFGKIMAAVLLISLVVSVACAVVILEGIGTPWVVLAISAAVAGTLTVAFNLEGRRI